MQTRRIKTKIMDKPEYQYPMEKEISDREGRKYQRGSMQSNGEADGMNQPVVEMVDRDDDMNGGQPK